MATTTIPAAVPVFPLSMFGPVHLGIDENGEQVHVYLGERNMLLGGEPGGGKSNALNLIVAHGALSYDGKLILIDGKQVELGPWRHCADRFIGPSMTDALDCARQLQQIMNDRYDTLLAAGLRKITPGSGEPVYLVVIDEYAYFSATVGTKQQQAEFSALTRDLVARGRAAGVIVILATQRPSHQVIDPIPAGPVRLPVGLPLHHRLQLGHRARARLGRGRLHRRQHRPARPGRVLAAVGDRRPPPRQGRLPVRRPDSRPGRARRPAPPQAGHAMSTATAPGCHNGQHHARPPAGTTTVNTPLTPDGARPVVENDAYAAFARRILRAYARRIATGDIESLTLMTRLADDIDVAIGDAVTGLRAFGYSWAEIGPGSA